MQHKLNYKATTNKINAGKNSKEFYEDLTNRLNHSFLQFEYTPSRGDGQLMKLHKVKTIAELKVKLQSEFKAVKAKWESNNSIPKICKACKRVMLDTYCAKHLPKC